MDTTTLSYILGALVLVLVGWIAFLELRLGRLFRGKRAHDMEEIIVDIGKFLDELEKNHRNFEKRMEDLDRRLRRSIQGVHTIRFNPFRDIGGNQSFATALLDEEGNGVVLSSLYTRDKVSVYSKPVARFESEFQLTREEAEAIANAKTH